MKERLSIARLCAVIILAFICVFDTAIARVDADDQLLIQQAKELDEQANRLDFEGKYSEGIPLAEKAVGFRERIFGPEHPETAASLETLGLLYRDYGDFTRAELLLHRALAIREKTSGESPETATTLKSLGGLYYLKRNAVTAQSFYQRALSIRQRTQGTSNRETAILLGSIGLINVELADYSRARDLFERALKMLEETDLGEDERTAWILDNLGALYLHNGTYAQARPLLERALRIREKVFGPRHLHTAITLTNLGRYYKLTGSFGQAESLFLRALEIMRNSLRPDHPLLGYPLQALGLLYARTGNYIRAQDCYSQVVSIEEKISGHSHFLSTSLSNLAESYVALGRYQDAERIFDRALSIQREERNTEVSQAATLEHLAILFFETGRRTKSESLFRQVLSMREKLLDPKHPDVGTAFANLAIIEWVNGRYENAVFYLEKSRSILAENSATVLLSSSESLKRTYLQSLSTSTSEYVTFSISQGERGGVAVGLNAVLNFKGRALDVMSNSVARVRQSIRVEDQDLFKKRAQIAGQLSALAYRAETSSLSDADRERLGKLSAQQEDLDAELAKRSTVIQQQVSIPTVVEVQKAIPPHTALIEWFRYTPFKPEPRSVNELEPKNSNRPRYVAYVIKHDTTPVVVDVGDAESIDALIRAFRTSIDDSVRSETETRALALAASKKILAPLYPHIKGINHLLISPDGALNLLPMEALLDEQENYLALRFDISYLTSARDMLRFDSVANSRNEAIVMADPNFGTFKPVAEQSQQELQTQRSTDLDRGGLIFRPLASTALEALDLSKLLNLDRSDVWLGDEATETRLKQVHGPRILHVATHGFFLSDQDFTPASGQGKFLGNDLPVFLGENPLLRSGIALAGANTRRSGANDDGILTALEVAQLDLHGTELVVLSACDSGVGEIKNGEGVYGLRRALVLAGAQTQVTSLWKVSDEATRVLMVDYYRRLLKGEGRSEALRHAQLALLSNPTYSHPYYWASFIPIGNWKPLPALH